MTKFPCPTRVDCPGTDSPISNYSSEGPDSPLWIGFSGGWWPGNKPRLGTPWKNPDGFDYCLSAIGQADAQRCANNGFPDQWSGNGISSDPTNPGDGGGTGVQTYASRQQQCTYTCPDGTPFTWTVAAGYARSARSQADADNIADSLACRLAIAHKICLSALDNKGTCADTDFFATVKATLGPLAKLPLTWTIQSGTLPPGLDLDTDTGGDPQQSLTVGIIGHVTAGASGDYNFLLRATDADGNFLQKSYKITVLKIAACPDNATPGIPYSFQMQTTGGTGPFKWSITVGNLPPGLTMTDAGLISGTTTTVQAKYPLTFSVLDTTIPGVSCTKDCTMRNECPGSNVLDMVITSRIFAGGACGCSLCVGNHNSMTYGRAVCTGIPEFCDMFYGATSFTSATNFTLRITVLVGANAVSGTTQNSMPLYRNGVFQQNLGLLFTLASGTQIVDVVLTAGTYQLGNGGVSDTRINYNFAGDGTGSVTWTFNNKC